MGQILWNTFHPDFVEETAHRVGGSFTWGTVGLGQLVSLGGAPLARISLTGTRRSGITTFSVAAWTTRKAVTLGSAGGSCFRFSMPQVCGTWGGGCQVPGSGIYFKLTHYRNAQIFAKSNRLKVPNSLTRCLETPYDFIAIQAFCPFVYPLPSLVSMPGGIFIYPSDIVNPGALHGHVHPPR